MTMLQTLQFPKECWSNAYQSKLSINIIAIIVQCNSLGSKKSKCTSSLYIWTRCFGCNAVNPVRTMCAVQNSASTTTTSLYNNTFSLYSYNQHQPRCSAFTSNWTNSSILSKQINWGLMINNLIKYINTHQLQQRHSYSGFTIREDIVDYNSLIRLAPIRRSSTNIVININEVVVQQPASNKRTLCAVLDTEHLCVARL